MRKGVLYQRVLLRNFAETEKNSDIAVIRKITKCIGRPSIVRGITERISRSPSSGLSTITLHMPHVAQ